MKKLLRRHKYVLIALCLYWPIVFTLTHIPVPQIARESGMSSKTMHTMAYFVLTFLIWCAVSPYQRVQWNRGKVWWILAIVAVYGAADEYLQGFVGRSPEVADFIANMIGAMLALGLLTVLSFWPALLAAAIVSIFVISNLSNLPNLYPQFHLNTMFHFSAYTALTLIWIQHIERYLHLRQHRAVWLLAAVALPPAILGVVLASGPYFGKSFWWVDSAAAVFGIAATVLITRLTYAATQRQHRQRKNTSQ